MRVRKCDAFNCEPPSHRQGPTVACPEIGQGTLAQLKATSSREMSHWSKGAFEAVSPSAPLLAITSKDDSTKLRAQTADEHQPRDAL